MSVLVVDSSCGVAAYLIRRDGVRSCMGSDSLLISSLAEEQESRSPGGPGRHRQAGKVWRESGRVAEGDWRPTAECA